MQETRTGKHSLIWGYGLAAVCVGAAAGMGWLSRPVVGSQIPFMVFVLATIVAAWYGGLGAGLAALVAGGFLGDYVFLSPPGSAEHHGRAEVMLLMTYGVSTLVSILLIEALRRERNVAERAAQQADSRSESLEREMAEHQRAEKALRESRRMLQSVLDTIPARVFWKDCRSVYIGCNRAFAEDIGVASPAQVPGKTDYELGLEQAELYRSDDRKVIESGQPKLNYEEPQTGLGAKMMWVRTSKIPLKDADNNTMGVLGTYEDITEKKRVEQGLAEAEAKYRCLVEEAIVGVYLIQGGRFAYVNAKLTQIFGYGRDEVAGREVWELVAPEDRGLVMENVRKLVSEEVRSIEYVFRGLRQDGQVIDVEVMGTSTVYNGKPAVIGSLLDITERRRAVEQLRQAKEAAEAADRAKDQFLAVLSHELRTPLTPVLAAAAMMQKDRSLPQKVLGNIQMIHRNVALEATLIDDLLDLTRIAKGKIELKVETVDIRALLERTVEMFRGDIEAKGLHLAMELESGPRYVRGDMTRLQQGFWNLLRNAIKFTGPGGRIGIRCSNGLGTRSRIVGGDCRLNHSSEVCPEAQNGGNMRRSVVVEVMDSGIGIEAEQIGRLFNAFEQAGRCVTKQFGGLGLGLSICKALVELHGGTISAMSPGKGQGATFRVELPVCSGELPSCKREGLTESADGEARGLGEVRDRVRLLLVEDHADTARVMANLLSGEGYAVQTAGDVASALELARRNRFDLIISDLGLPDGSGLDLMRALRADGCAVRAIALSGYGMEEDVRKSREAGFVEHLTKPVDVERLAGTIRRVLGEGQR